jgi:hypothetical protein
MLNEAKTVKRQFLITCIVALLIFITGLSSTLVEQVYARFIYKYLSICLRFISSLVPFALGDILYVLLVVYCVYGLVNYVRNLAATNFKKQQLYLAPLRLLKFALVLYIVFKILWGLNYSRKPIAAQLHIGNEKYNPTQLVALAAFLIDKTNAIQQRRLQVQVPVHQQYSTKELEALAVASYRNMNSDQPFFRYSRPALKKVFNTLVITKIGLEGYYNPLSGEANINMRIPAHSLPFVACHEIAHQLGVGREDEANLIAYLVAGNSKDVNFQYAANYSVLRSVLFEVRFKSPEVYEKLIEKINPETILDFKREKDFWMRYNSDMYAYMDVALDSFLKLNNQKKGIDSYQDIVIWVYNLNKNHLK